MNTYLMTFKKWYHLRNLREKALFIGLCWACTFIFFSFAIFQPVKHKVAAIQSALIEANNKINDLDSKIEGLNKISQSELYKKWAAQDRRFQVKKSEYKSELLSSSNIQWQEMIKSILASTSNITIEQIKNSPESVYTIPNLVQSTNIIYEQKLNLVITSNYFDTINYLKRLEQILPTIHWNSIHYQVLEYPKARVDMEFSVLYEKPTSQA